MKLHRALIPALGATAVFGVPFKMQIPLGVQSAVSQTLSAFGFGLESNVVLSAANYLWSGTPPKKEEKSGVFLDANYPGRTFTVQGGITYELVTHPSFPKYQIRVTSPKLCDPDVQQYSGYLDIDEDKHLFFWFFESRKNSTKAPLVLWLNGGPGCSSTTGLLFELGPCSIANSGRDTVRNPYGWNEFANMIFLDQPVNVGYSYSEGSVINNSPAAAEDVYAFLQLFLARHEEYASAPFTISGESYAGRYIPLIASTIHKQNQALKSSDAYAMTKHINLSSIMIGNGLTEPFTQMGSVPEQACDGPYPIYNDPDGPECQSLRSKVPTCQRLIQSCYDYNSRFTCVPAGIYCNSQLFSGIQQLGLNPYDTRRKCDRREDKDGPLCYAQMGDIETFMNNDTVKRELGVTGSTNFQSCNMNVNQAFFTQGDGTKNSAAVLPEMLQDGIRLLVYAGNADFMCNAIGNLEWMEKLENPFKEEFNSNGLVPWQVLKSGRIAGMVKSAGGGGFSAGNYTYVVVHEAGHMVPYDQPEASLDMFVRWLTDIPLA